MTFAPSLTQLMVYGEVQGTEGVMRRHDVDVQQSWVPRTPLVITVTGVIPSWERVVAGVVILTPFSLRVLAHKRRVDRPQGELVTRISREIMHMVPSGILLQDAREGWALSQGEEAEDVGVLVREQSMPRRAQQTSQDPYPEAASAFWRRDCMMGMHSAWALA